MIENNDITKYLEMIGKTEKTNPDVPPPRASENIELKRNFFVDPTCDIRGWERMLISKGVIIQKDCWLNIAHQRADTGPMIIIGEGSNIGRRCTISAANSITIGNNVLIAPNVFIADTHHEYRDITMPIMHQGITTHEDKVTIGDETWIGINAVIMGNVHIGRHCVIGANSVVNRTIPDYCVAVGSPARVVKLYDTVSGKWVAVRTNDELNRYLDHRATAPAS